MSKSCRSWEHSDWIAARDGATNEDVLVCHAACPPGTLQLSASETYRADTGEEFSYHSNPIEMGAFGENYAMQKALELTDPRQFLARIQFDDIPDSHWSTTYTGTVLCAKP